MTKLNKNIEVKNATNVFAQEKDMSKSELAKLIGISAGVLSHLEAEKFDLISEETILKIWNFVRPNQWNLIKTANYEAIFKICRDAKRSGKLVSIIGYPGAGKTTALKEFYKKPNVYYISCKKSMKPRQFFEKLLRQLNLDYTGTIFDMIEKASERLNSKSSPLVIIDEAGKMSPALLLYLHDLRDNTAGNAGIVLSGVDYFKANLIKAVARQKEGMPELFSRIIMWYELRAINKLEIEAVCRANGLTDEGIINNLIRGENRVKDYRDLFNAIVNYKQIEDAGIEA